MKSKKDVIVGETKGILSVQATSQAIAEAMLNISDNSEGIAISVAFASSFSAGSLTLIGYENHGVIETGQQKDTIKGIASGEASAVAVASAMATAVAIVNDTASATAISSAVAVAQAIADITVVGIDNLGKIDTGDGKDIVAGEASAFAVAETFTQSLALAFASTNNNGEAIALANAVASATAQATATTIGIKDGEFHLGSGDDVVNATATGDGINIGIRNAVIYGGKGDDSVNVVATGGGVNLGIQEVLIYGDQGDDTFNLQNGTGNIFGGKGEDLLILKGHFADYKFYDTDHTFGVHITNTNNGTDLFVREVENFQFTEDLSITYAYTNLHGIG